MTITDHHRSILNRILSLKHNSLAAYIAQAQPYVGKDDDALFDEIKNIAGEDEEMVKELAALLEKLEVAPQISLPAADISELNYLTVRYLAAVLRNDLESQTAQYQALVVQCAGVEAIEASVRKLLASTRDQARRLSLLLQ